MFLQYNIIKAMVFFDVTDVEVWAGFRHKDYWRDCPTVRFFPLHMTLIIHPEEEPRESLAITLSTERDRF